MSQRDQVIIIKDNTIAELKHDFGQRSSGAVLREDTETKEVACLALPDTREVKCQTHGPRKSAYYKSIPAKINTNLRGRSPSTSLERAQSYDNGAVLRARKSREASMPGSSPGKAKRSKTGVSSSQSPSRRLLATPEQAEAWTGTGNGAARRDNHALEDMKSLRLQLLSLIGGNDYIQQSKG